MARLRTADRPPSIHDVAAAAGVSHQTVSRVLNHSNRVTDSTKEKVLAAIKELGYRRNSVARALVTRKSGIFGVVTTTSWHYGPQSILLSVEIAAREAGYYTVVAPVDDSDRDAVRRAFEHFLTLPVEGIVFIAPTREVTPELWEGELPVPLIAVTSGEVCPETGAVTVKIGQEAPARALMEHLFDLGHTDIVHIPGPAPSFEAGIRERVWEQAMAERGLPVRRVSVRGWEAQVGLDAGRELLADGVENLPTAVFCANDEIALGLYRAFDEAGVRIPQDVSVVGFDDLPHVTYYRPALTTVAQDFPTLGAEIVRVLRAAVEGTSAGQGVGAGQRSPDSPADVTLPAQIVVRESTAAPR